MGGDALGPDAGGTGVGPAGGSRHGGRRGRPHRAGDRGILLIFSDDERVRRMHRALCVVHDAVERRMGAKPAELAGTSMASGRP